MTARQAPSRLWRCRSGASAIEFAIFAPLVCLGLLLMIDVAYLTVQRMELDRGVRAGAQAAMSLNNDAAAIREVVRAAVGNPADMSVGVSMICACGTAPAGCSALCAGGEAPSVFFAISAERPVSGTLLGRRTAASGTRVQIR